MINMASNPNIYHLYTCYAGLALNLFVLFAGILKNPGIPQLVIKRMLKERLGKSQSGEGDLSSDEQDLEAGKKEPSTSKAPVRSKRFCNDCRIETTPDMYHCEDCLVCIEDYDHHCVFFSKCIGGGNLKCFWGSMAMLLVNFVLVATMVAFAAFYETEDDK
jgi:hypothetical protein